MSVSTGRGAVKTIRKRYSASAPLPAPAGAWPGHREQHARPIVYEEALERMARSTQGTPLARALAVFATDTAGRGNWGNPGLTRILKGVRLEEAMWTPAPNVHSIWEEVNHIAYWSRFTLDYLEGRAKWIKQAWPAGKGGARGWRRAVAEASRLHASLARLTESLDEQTLSRRFGLRRPSRYTTAQLILGCASHIAYHVGQIAVMRRLFQHALGRTSRR